MMSSEDWTVDCKSNTGDEPKAKRMALNVESQSEDWTVECQSNTSSECVAKRWSRKVRVSSEGWSGECQSNNGAEEEVKRPTNVLYIREYNRDSQPIDRNIIGFSNHRKLGSFRIDDNQSYNDSDCNQNVINDSIDFEMISKMNINLMEGFDESSLITDYKSYKLLKWKYFLKWIQKSGCLENRSSESLPHFISFGGLFTSLMSTPNRIESWYLLVTKFKDSIFMNKIRLNADSNGRTDQRSDVQKSNGFVDKTPFLAAKVTQIITQMNGQSVKDVVNEYEKYFSCYETQIGDHRLLLMSEMDAIDEEGNQYEVKCAKHLNFGRKLFNWWSHCVVADIDCILIGVKDDNEILKSVHKLRTNELPEMSTFRWNTDLSYDFVNRVLNYIKQLLESADDLEVFKVWFKKNDKCVRSTKLPANHLIPNWFTGHDSEEADDNPMELNL